MAAEVEKESELSDSPEEALASAMKNPELERGSYYELCAGVGSNYWAFEWISPKPASLSRCCLVPTIKGMGLLGGQLEGLGAEVLVSLGSGAGLVEWLLAGRFERVICVDVFYRPEEGGAVSSWVMPQLRGAVASSWTARGEEGDRRGDDESGQEGRSGIHFVHPSETTKLREIVDGQTVAFLLCWPQLQPCEVAAYAEAVGGHVKVRGVMVVAGENCSPEPRAAAAAAGCREDALVADGQDVKCLSEPCRVWTFPTASPAVRPA